MTRATRRSACRTTSLLVVVLLLLLPAVLLAPVLLAPGAQAAPAVPAADVHGDDDRDRYVGTGGLLLPGSVDERTRREVASCGGCAWRLSSPCVASVLGNAFGDPCGSVVRGCPAGELLRSWFRPLSGAWRETGLVCLGRTGPTTVEQVGRAVADRVERGIPRLAPSFQPAHGVLAQLPVAFSSGQPAGRQAWDLPVAGHAVAVTASPVWTWSFGDGAGARTSDPGGRYPVLAVSHVYRAAGRLRATCTTTWSATFTVDGLGPFTVPEDLVQQAHLDLTVGEGRAELVPVPRPASPGAG